MNYKNDPLVPKKLIIPFILVTLLFAMWGFANSVTDPMVQAFKKVLELSNTQASWIQMAFYGGYFSMALPAAIFIRKYSYKSGILIGLLLYSFGALMFYPAANTGEFWFFCVGLYILTFGLAFLETTANPYILSMGSKTTASRRLNLAQSFNPFGLLFGLFIAQQFVLKNLESDDISNFELLDESQRELIRNSDLLVIRDPYVYLGIFVLIIFVVFVITKMPKSKEEGSFNFNNTLKKLLKNKKYIFGVFAQLFYVGAQIMCWTFIYLFAEAIDIDSANAANFQFIAFILFLLGRWLNTYLLKYFSSHFLLLFFSCFGILFVSITILNNNIIGLYSLVSLSLCMSLMFPTIYAISLEDLNKDDSKIGAAGLVMAIVGGALLPRFQAQIIDLGGSGVSDLNILGLPEVNISFILPLICFIYIAIYSKLIPKFNNS